MEFCYIYHSSFGWSVCIVIVGLLVLICSTYWFVDNGLLHVYMVCFLGCLWVCFFLLGYKVVRLCAKSREAVSSPVEHLTLHYQVCLYLLASLSQFAYNYVQCFNLVLTDNRFVILTHQRRVNFTSYSNWRMSKVSVYVSQKSFSFLILIFSSSLLKY